MMICAAGGAKEITVIFGGRKLFEIHSLSLLSCEPLGMQRSGIVRQKVYFLTHTKQRKNMTKPVAFYANLVYNVHKDVVVAARVKKYTF